MREQKKGQGAALPMGRGVPVTRELAALRTVGAVVNDHDSLA
jgi:hypothetical protein